MSPADVLLVALALQLGVLTDFFLPALLVLVSTSLCLVGVPVGVGGELA